MAGTLNESSNEFKARLKGVLNDSRFALELAKARQSAYSAQRTVKPNYIMGDRVGLQRSLFRDAIAQNQASKKLGPRRFGPVPILALVGRNAVRLDLSSNIRIHPVVHVEHTMPFRDRPSDICPPVPLRPAPVPDAEGAP